MPAPILLTDSQVQAYLTNGYITVQTAHPPAVHQNIHRQIETLFAIEGNPGNDILPKIPDLHQILRDPAVAGALQSLLGPSYLIHPHRHCHHNPSGSRGQGMHQDSYENDQSVRHHRTRWTMAFYYPQDVSLDMGPTAILPATQYYNSSKQAYEREEQPLCGRAGTVTIVHYDLWHRAMPNASDRDRFMVKFLFTRMGEPQTSSWDHRDGTWQAAGTDPPAELCRRAWDWMRGSDDTTAPTEVSLGELRQSLEAEAETERQSALADFACPALGAIRRHGWTHVSGRFIHAAEGLPARRAVLGDSDALFCQPTHAGTHLHRPDCRLYPLPEIRAPAIARPRRPVH